MKIRLDEFNAVYNNTSLWIWFFPTDQKSGPPGPGYGAPMQQGGGGYQQPPHNSGGGYNPPPQQYAPQQGGYSAPQGGGYNMYEQGEGYGGGGYGPVSPRQPPQYEMPPQERYPPKPQHPPHVSVLHQCQYAILQWQIVCSGLHLVTYLDVGNFCDRSTETTLHDICVQVFLRFSDSSKPGNSVSLIYELAWLAGIGKSKENLIKISCKVAPVTEVAHILWWSHDNWKQSTSAREHWYDIGSDIPQNMAWSVYRYYSIPLQN